MPDRPLPANVFRAKLLALEAATVCFLVITLLGFVAGAESHVAAVRGLIAGALVAFVGPFPIRVLLDALEAPHDAERQGEADAPARPPPP